MPRRLSKEESRKRYREGRDLWNEFDPIGVFKMDENWPTDEYESYVGPCLRFVEENKDRVELESYVRWVVFDHMGLSESKALDEAIICFAEKFSEWYRTKWVDTVV